MEKSNWGGFSALAGEKPASAGKQPSGAYEDFSSGPKIAEAIPADQQIPDIGPGLGPMLPHMTHSLDFAADAIPAMDYMVDTGEAEAEDESNFDKLKNKLAHKPGVTNPAGLAAKIGREKLGEKEMERRSIAGKEKAEDDKRWQPDSPGHENLEKMHNDLISQGYKHKGTSSSRTPGVMHHMYEGKEGKEGRKFISERKKGNHEVINREQLVKENTPVKDSLTVQSRVKVSPRAQELIKGKEVPMSGMYKTSKSEEDIPDMNKVSHVKDDKSSQSTEGLYNPEPAGPEVPRSWENPQGTGGGVTHKPGTVTQAFGNSPKQKGYPGDAEAEDKKRFTEPLHHRDEHGHFVRSSTEHKRKVYPSQADAESEDELALDPQVKDDNTEPLHTTTPHYPKASPGEHFPEGGMTAHIKKSMGINDQDHSDSLQQGGADADDADDASSWTDHFHQERKKPLNYGHSAMGAEPVEHAEFERMGMKPAEEEPTHKSSKKADDRVPVEKVEKFIEKVPDGYVAGAHYKGDYAVGTHPDEHKANRYATLMQGKIAKQTTKDTASA